MGFTDIISTVFDIGATAFSIGQELNKASNLAESFELTEQAIQSKEAARREESRLEKLKLARQRRGVAREARLARGQALQAGASSGASVLSAGVAGGVGGAESVAAASQAFLSQNEAGVQTVSDFLGQAAGFESASARAKAKAARAGELSQVAQQTAGGAGDIVDLGIDLFKTLF